MMPVNSYAESQTEPAATAYEGMFPLGNPVPFPNFTGNAYLSPVVPNETIFNCPSMNNITFEPCARTDWHTHDGGQILIAVYGTGYHQIEGLPVEILQEGDVVMVEPGVKHWHGAGY